MENHTNNNAKTVSGGAKPINDNEERSNLNQEEHRDGVDEDENGSEDEGGERAGSGSIQSPHRHPSRTPFTSLSQVDADLALARTLQEQVYLFFSILLLACCSPFEISVFRVLYDWIFLYLFRVVCSLLVGMTILQWKEEFEKWILSFDTHPFQLFWAKLINSWTMRQLNLTLSYFRLPLGVLFI